MNAGTEREQLYINAVRAMYQGYATVPGSTRWQDYLMRINQLRDKYLDDINASLFYGLDLTWTAGPGQKGVQQRRQAWRSSCPALRSTAITQGQLTTSSMPLTWPSLHRSPSRSKEVRSHCTRLAPCASHTDAHLQPARPLAGLHKNQ